MALEEIYEDLDTDVSLDEFRDRVEDRVDQMGGLMDEEAAAMLVASELTGDAVETVADIQPGQDEVKFTAKVTRVGELRTFDRDDDEEGRVVNLTLADETGSIRVAFWDDRADAAVEEIAPGDVLRVVGRPKEGYDGVEVNVDRAELDEDAQIEVDLGGQTTIEALSMGQSGVDLTGRVLDTEPVRTFNRDDGSEGQVANIALGDETGRIRVTLWDGMATRVESLEAGTSVAVVDGYVRERDGQLELHVGSRGAVEELDESVEYVPDATPIAQAEIGETVDIAGVVRSADSKRTFDRDDGSEGQVRNVRVQDQSGDIRVALWGDKADRDLGPGDEVLLADVEVQEGWQDDLEASANWRSTVSILDSGSAPSQASSPTDADANGSEQGLDAFTDGEAPAESGGPGADQQPAGEAAMESAQVEFTGVVVQAGDPVLLDDGEQTMTVATSAEVHLGQEVVVRGELHDGTLQAEEFRSA